MNLLDARRFAPRISVDGFCGVATDHDELRHASMSDLSTLGLRLERPYEPATARPIVQLEIELPGLDEVIWTSAIVTRAYITPLPGRRADGTPRFWCRGAAPRRDLSTRAPHAARLRDRPARHAPHHGDAARSARRVPWVS